MQSLSVYYLCRNFQQSLQYQIFIPDDTNQERPPTTDSDGDGIPDVHENLFTEWINGTSVDGRGFAMKGLDKDDASDATLDNDNDGIECY